MKHKTTVYAVSCLAFALALTATNARVFACPFCNVESKTLSEDMNSSDTAVLAKLIQNAPAAADPNDPNSGMATFEIVSPLKGGDGLKAGTTIRVVSFDSDHEKTYLVTGIGKDKIDWSTPLPLAATAVDYVKKLPSVPAAGADRLVFFQDYLENKDPLLSQDAYDEFGRAPYSELRELKPKMLHDRIVQWVEDPEVSPARRRLYLTMLGVCGTKDDVLPLEELIKSDYTEMKPTVDFLIDTCLAFGGPPALPIYGDLVRQDEYRKKQGLDALIACYLILRGPDGLDLIENRFLKNPHAEYTHVYSTLMALRFHGDENTGIIPRERLLAAARLLLTNPDFNDQVILDLSRWEDWSILDEAVAMFKNSDTKGYVRQPVVSYLTVASEQEGDVGTRAKAAIAELEKIDPETVKTARGLMAFGALSRARGAASAANGQTAQSTGGDPVAIASAATDVKQGFAASPEDEKTDTSQIPDPASFGQAPTGSTAPAPPKIAEKPAIAAETKTAPTTTNQTPAPVASVIATSPPARPTSPLVVAGIPLAAAIGFMGIYWLILRAGAV